MLSRLRQWFRDVGTYNTRHREAWSGLTDVAADGYSPFQHDCERRLTGALSLRGFELRNRRIEPDALQPGFAPTAEAGLPGCTIVAEVRELRAQIWLSCDQTMISTPTAELNLEEWDTRTPAEHYAMVEEFVANLPETTPEGTA